MWCCSDCGSVFEEPVEGIGGDCCPYCGASVIYEVEE